MNPEERYMKELNGEINIDATIVDILPKDEIKKDYFLLSLLEYINTL